MSLDERLRASLHEVPVGDGPDDGDRAAVERMASGLRRRRTRVRAAVGSVVAVVVLVVLVVAWPRTGDDLRTVGPAERPATGSSTPEGWETITDPTFGWTIQVPTAWSTRSFFGMCRIGLAGTLVRNNGAPPPFETAVDGCTTSLDWNGVGADSVIVSLTHRAGGPAPSASLGDSTFPLDIDAASVPVAVPDTGPSMESLGTSSFSAVGLDVVVAGDPGFNVTIAVGVDASESDITDARRIVTSIRPPSSDRVVPPPATLLTRTVALPSRPRDPSEPWMAALATGTLVREGDCLYLDTEVGTRYTLVWSAEAEMTIIGEELAELRVGDQSFPDPDSLRMFGGGEVDWGQLGVSNLREECRTEKMWMT